MTKFTFTVPAGASNVTMNGHFASGGSDNEIQVVVVNEDEFLNWLNGHPPKTFYNSGKATQDSINLSLSPEAATYHVVFNNRFSLIPKTLHASVELNFYTR